MIGFLIIFLGVYYSVDCAWSMPQDWIVNANFEEEICVQAFHKYANSKVGMNQTLYKSTILFVLIGMIFGWPYALLHFSALQWVNTSPMKKFVRTFIGLLIALGVREFFTWTVSHTNDISTMYFFGFALPYFLISFFIFGIYPIMCAQWLHLVQSNDQFAIQFPDLGRLQKMISQATNQTKST